VHSYAVSRTEERIRGIDYSQRSAGRRALACVRISACSRVVMRCDATRTASLRVLLLGRQESRGSQSLTIGMSHICHALARYSQSTDARCCFHRPVDDERGIGRHRTTSRRCSCCRAGRAHQAGWVLSRPQRHRAVSRSCGPGRPNPPVSTSQAPRPVGPSPSRVLLPGTLGKGTLDSPTMIIVLGLGGDTAGKQHVAVVARTRIFGGLLG
jgi:hypothetical protein